MPAWNADTAAGASETDAVTVVEGSSFCISSHTGDIDDGGSQGVFYQDTRIISRLVLRINGAVREPLLARKPAAFHATFVGRARWSDGRFDSPLVVRHQRHVGPGLQDDITILNYSSESAVCGVEVSVDGDQADLFDVKAGRVGTGTALSRSGRGGEAYVEAGRDGQRRGTAVRAAGAEVGERTLAFRVEIPPRGQWSTSVIVVPVITGTRPDEPFPDATLPHRRGGVRRQGEWQENTPRLTVSHPN